MGFAKRPPQALDTARRVLDRDAEFRERVVAATTEKAMGRASWLFLTRPNGWEGELESLLAAGRGRTQKTDAAKSEEELQRRVKRAEEAAERASRALEKERAALAKAADEKDSERRGRRAAEQESRTLRRRVQALERERDEAQARSGTAGEGRGDAGEVADARTRPGASGDERVDTSEVEAIRPFLDHAAWAARELMQSLDAARQALPPRPAKKRGALARSDRPPTRPPTGARRRPTPLPPATFDDSVEGADHLVRVKGMELLVDGYNAAHSAWPGLTPSEQRRRLVDALGELAARAGTRIHAVFDGAEGVDPAPPAKAKRLVRISFSPAGIEADDVILDLIGKLPPERPVAVASDDRRVRQGAVDRGANVISVAQLFAILGRER